MSGTFRQQLQTMHSLASPAMWDHEGSCCSKGLATALLAKSCQALQGSLSASLHSCTPRAEQSAGRQVQRCLTWHNLT